MKKIADMLLGDEHMPFEHRIYNFCILLGAVVTTAGLTIDVINGVTMIWLNFSFVIVWLLSYYLTRFRGYYKIVVPLSVGILTYVFFTTSWIFTGGIYSVLPLYSILFLAVACVVLSGAMRMFMVVSHIVLQMLLILFGVYLSGESPVNATYQAHQIELLIHLTVVMISISVLIIMYSNTYRREKARGEIYAKAIEENYRQQLYYMENLEQLVSRLRAERHDFNNHLSIIYGLLADGEVEDGKRYAATLVGAAREHQNLVALPYSLLRVMINYKLTMASEQGIRLNLVVDVPPGLTFNESDMAIIIGIVLDNAVEACQKVADKYITFNLYYKPDYLILRVENPANPEASMPSWLGGKSRTSKLDEENHGFGLRNIKYLVDKHDGLFEVDFRMSVFKVNIALLVEGKEAG